MFEFKLWMNIVVVVKMLYKSGVKFVIFLKIYGNIVYWRVLLEGVLELKYRMLFLKVIWDIVENGLFYVFECVIVIVVIYYLVLIDIIGEEKFDVIFDRIILYDWYYEKLLIYMEIGYYFFFGDCLYFKNFEFDL